MKVRNSYSPAGKTASVVNSAAAPFMFPPPTSSASRMSPWKISPFAVNRYTYDFPSRYDAGNWYGPDCVTTSTLPASFTAKSNFTWMRNFALASHLLVSTTSGQVSGPVPVTGFPEVDESPHDAATRPTSSSGRTLGTRRRVPAARFLFGIDLPLADARTSPAPGGHSASRGPRESDLTP